MQSGRGTGQEEKGLTPGPSCSLSDSHPGSPGQDLPAGKAHCPGCTRRLLRAGVQAIGRNTHVPRKSGESRPKRGEKLQGFSGDPGGKHVIYKPDVYGQNQISSEAHAQICMFLQLAPPSLNPPARTYKPNVQVPSPLVL